MARGPALSFQTVTGTGLSTFSELLKEYYEPALNERLLNRDVFAFKFFRRKMAKFSGQRWYGAAITHWPESGGARLEGAFMPFPYSSRARNPIVYCKDYYGRLRWSGQVERATKSEKGAWADAVKQEIKNFRNRANEHLSHMFIVGRYGILGEVSSDIDTTASTAMVMQSADSGGRTSTAPWRFGTQFLRPDQELRAVAAVPAAANPETAWTLRQANTAGQTDFRIISPDTGLTQLPAWNQTAATLNAKTASDHIGAATDLLIGHNTRPTSGVDRTSDQVLAGFSGLQEIVDDGTLYTQLFSIARDTTGANSSPSQRMNALVLANGGTQRALSESVMQTAIDRAKNLGTGEPVTRFFAHDATRWKYAQLLQAVRMFTSGGKGEVIANKAGFEDDELAYVGGGKPIPFTTSKDFLPGTIHGVREASFEYKYISEPGFLETDGVVRRFVADYDQTEIIWHLDGNLYCDTPNANLRIDDIEFSTSDYTAVA